MRRSAHFRLAVLIAAAVLLAATSAALAKGTQGSPPPMSETDRRIHEAFEFAYNLDHEQAIARLEQAIAKDPIHAGAHRGLATITWLNLLFRRGMILVDHYLGPVSKENVKLKPPPSEIAAAFKTHVGKSVALAEERVRKAPNDPAALYDLGAAVGLQASYTATVEGRVAGAFGAARRAFNTHERVLELAPHRRDAGLIVGIQRYLVASLILPARWVAYMVGFGGDKQKAFELIEGAATYEGLAQTDARFALVLLRNREMQYDRALEQLRILQKEYPRNRLLWLEAGATLLRANRPKEAEAMLTEGIGKLQEDTRPRMAGEEGLWYYRRGMARVMLKQQDLALRDLTTALDVDTQAWVKGRTHLELGKVADLSGDRPRARAEYDRCVKLCDAANDGEAAREARELRDNGYKG